MIENYDQYLAELHRNLSWLEHLSDSCSGLDERIDVANKLLLQINRLLKEGLQVEFPEKPPSPPVSYSLYSILTYSLDVARPSPGEEVTMTGNTLTAFTDGTLEGVYVRLGYPTRDAIPLNEFNPCRLTTGWEAFWLETPAQPGKYLRLYIGREASAEASLALSTKADELVLPKLVPEAKAAIFNTALPVAEVNWLGTDIDPTNSPSYLRVYACVSIAGVLRVARTVGAVTVTEDLNSSADLTPDAAYMFTIEWREGDCINFRYSTTTGNIKVFRVDEICAAE